MMMKTIVLITLLFCTTISFSQVGIGTNTPQSTLDINGNLSVKHLELPEPPSASVALQDISDGVYISINPNVTDQIFRLPNATAFPGRVYIIRNINDTLTAQLRTNGGLLFPKNSTVGSTEIYMYEGNLRTVTVISDGINWTYLN